MKSQDHFIVYCVLIITENEKNKKMKILFIYILLMASLLHVNAQSEYENVLLQIEENNSTLEALREQMEAQKLGNRTDIYLSDPEVEFNYLWGNPSEIGNRTDFSISQSFDFPTAYGHRSKIAKLENANLDISYKSERLNFLLSAKQTCIQLAYNNALAKEYTRRLENAKRIAETYRIRLDKGDANILESNKAELSLTSVQNELDKIEIEQTSLLSELKRLNGGKEIQFPFAAYPDKPLPSDFAEWYSLTEPKSPVLQYVKAQIEISQQQVKLNKAMNLPKFSAGYMSEKVVGERYQGIMLGISIPLWENKNKVKQAKAQVRANESMFEDSKIQFYNRLQNLYLKAFSLQQNVVKYKKALASFSNETFLKKALDAGEISLLNYLLELEYYYDTMDKTLEAERDLELAKAELSSLEL